MTSLEELDKLIAELEEAKLVSKSFNLIDINFKIEDN